MRCHQKLRRHLKVMLLIFCSSAILMFPRQKGDILVRPEDQGNSTLLNAPLADPNRLWPSGMVAYKFWRTFPPGNLPFTFPTIFLTDLRALTRKAMDYLTDMYPCITFVPAVPKSPNFVTIYPGTKCRSEIGMRGGDQSMYLNSACFDRGLIVPVHELMHTLGFVHEHNRTLVLAGSWFCYKPFWIN